MDGRIILGPGFFAASLMRGARASVAARTLSCALCAALLALPAARLAAEDAKLSSRPRLPVRLAENRSKEKTVKSFDGEKIDVEEARRLFQEHQLELERVEREKQGLETETKALKTETAALQTKLIDAAQQVQQAEKQLTRSEGEIAELAKQEAQIRVALKDNRAALAQMLGVMQRMGREPPPVMMTERNDALRMVRSAMILSSFFPGFKERADKLSETLADLNAIITKSRQEHVRLAQAQTDFSRLKSEVDTLMAEKREKMQKNWEQMEELKAAALRHSRAISDFGALLKRLDAEVASNSNLGEYEAELKKNGPVVELKPTVEKAAFVSPGRMKPAMPFEKAKGSLPFPAEGKRLKSFGVRDDVGGKAEGIYVQTRVDSQVRSPCDGWVIYAGQFRSYGQLLIINAGGGYHILLAGLDQIYATVGQFVLAGEPVAAMGKTPPPADSPQSRNPVLYIEFRKDARPVDPDPWWSEGVKEG